MIIPKRHFSDYFDIKQAEINAINQLVIIAKNKILENDSLVSGFNLGVNSGSDAGQTIFHCHLHLIPRRIGDVENVKEGIRNIINKKGGY